MAVDRKSDYVGNHGGAYIDNDGMSKQFTYIDHDSKTKISGHLGINKEKVKKDLSEYKISLIERIVNIPASLCPLEYDAFIVRGEGKVGITWNETMLNDPGLSTDRLRNLCTLLENRNNKLS